MKGRFWKKALAASLALLIVSGSTPIKPLSQVFDRTAITASAAKQTVEKTVMFKMDGGDSGETTLLDDNTLYTTAGGANNTLHWTCNDPNPNNSTNIYFQNTTTPSGKHRFKTGFHGNILSSDPSIEFLDIEGTVTKVEMVNFNLYGEVVKVSAGKNRSDTSTLLHLKDTDNEYDFRSVGGQESLNTYSTAIFVGNVNVDKDNPLKIFFTGTVKDDVSFCEFSFKNDGSGYISVTYETEEEVTGDPGHSFSYTTSGDTLTATCNQTDPNHNCGLTDHKATLKLSADDVPYNALIHTASVNKQEFVNATGITDITTTFSYKNKATNEVRTNGVYEIGDYTVTATITISGTAYTLTKDFSISENTHSITNNCSGLYLNRTTARPFEEVHITVDPSINLTSLSVTGATANLTLENHGIWYSDQNGYYWFQMPDEDVTVNAEQTDYSISVSDSIEHGSVTASVGTTENATTATNGDTVILNVTPESGYTTKSVSVNGTAIEPVEGVYSFTMPDSNVTVTAEFEAMNNIINSANITLGGELGLNFYLTIPDDVVTAGAKVVMDGPEGEKEVVLSSLTKDDKGRYKVTYKIKAVYINENVSLNVTDSDGNTLDLFKASGSQVDNNTLVYSIYDYVQSAKADTALTEKEHNMVDTMYTYGAYSAKWFNDTALPNNVNELNDLNMSDYEKYKLQTVGSSSSITLTGLSLILDSNTALRLYFTSADDISGHSAKIDDVDLTIHPTETAGKYYVEIDDISANNLISNYSIVFDGTYTATVSTMTYVYNSLKNGTTDDVMNVLKALCAYSDAVNKS